MYIAMREHDLDLDLVKKRLLDFEGMVLTAYRCKSNLLTIGVGRQIENRGITEEEALYLLENDIKETIAQLDKHWAVWTSFPPKAQHVCVDLVFNMGINTFMSFRKTRSYMELGEWEKAGDELLNSQYAKQVGRRAIFNSEELKSLT
jgi:lysozyme